MEIGAKLSDVFGADAILWVEGDTETFSFPMILGKDNIGMDVKFSSIVNTGDLITKKRKLTPLILKIYKNLSQGDALIPKAIGFNFRSRKFNK